MSTNLILDYQRWAKRGYVEPLTCPSHSLDLFPSETPEGIALVCPKFDYKMVAGAATLLRLQRKIDMAKRLFKDGK